MGKVILYQRLVPVLRNLKVKPHLTVCRNISVTTTKKLRTRTGFERLVPFRLNLNVESHLTIYRHVLATRIHEQKKSTGGGLRVFNCVPNAEDYRSNSLVRNYSPPLGPP